MNRKQRDAEFRTTFGTHRGSRRHKCENTTRQSSVNPRRPHQQRHRSLHNSQGRGRASVTLNARGIGVREIPGFYYDPEKKRYFKITREHPRPAVSQGSCPAVRQTDGHDKIGDQCGANQGKKHMHATSILKCLWDRECNAKSLLSSPRKCLEKLAQQLKVKQTLSLDPLCCSYVSADDFSVMKIEPNIDNTRILTLYNASPGGQIVQFHCLDKNRSNQLEIIPKMAMMKDQLVTGLAWSPHEQTSDFYILSLLGHGNDWGETLMFQVNSPDQRHIATFPVRGHSVWCSTWNRNPLYSHIIGIGGSKVAVTVDINTKRRVKYAYIESDVFAQEFSRRNPVFYNGSRDGCVRSCDIRVKDTDWPQMCFRHGKMASITCIRLLQDENYLMTSTVNGQMKMWDVRNVRCVQEYRGHVNQMKLSLPFFLDPTDSLLFSAGQDSVTRIWSVQNGKLLHSIPFPGDAGHSLSSIPALCFADEWGGRGGLPGLMYGTDDNIKLYTY